MLLNAHAGAKYGIPFPVFVRASFGVARREHSGHAARHRRVRMVRHSVLDRRPGHPRHARRDLAGVAAAPWSVWACFLGFWLLNMVVVWRGVESIRFLQGFSAPFMLDHVACCCSFSRCTRPAASAPCFPRPASSTPPARSCASSSRRSPRWSATGRRSRSTSPTSPATPRSQHSQIVGQAFGLPVAMTLYSLHRHRRHLRLGRHLRPRHLEPHRAAWGAFISPWSPSSRMIAAAGRDAQRQRRRQRRLAFERLLQPQSAAGSPSAPAASSPASSASP